MTAQHLIESKFIDGIPAQRLLQGLARIYRWILVTDSDRRILWASDDFSDLFGDGETALGMDSRNLLKLLPRPEQVFPIRSNLRHRNKLSSVPLELRTKSGERIPAEVNIFSVESGGNDAPLMVAIARRRKQEEARAGGLDAALIDCSPDAIVAVDAEGYVLHANLATARLLGRDREELVGRPAALLFGEDAPQIDSIATALHRAAGPTQCDLAIRREDSRHTRVSVTASVLRTEGASKQNGYALFLREVTEPREEEAELRKTNRELEHCVQALAHDLRSPLVALLGFSRLLRQDYAELLDESGAHFLDRIEQSGRTMESLIHDLLELSRIGQRGDRPSFVDPRAVFMQLQAELKPRLESAGIRLVLPDAPSSLVYCDRTRLYQVMSNLIGNAIEHMGERRHALIQVSVAEDAEGHVITVRDNGCGISRENQERIFEVFQSMGRTDGRKGTGIGLAIVKKIAETRGGRVWVESTPGAGSSFHIRLPRH